MVLDPDARDCVAEDWLGDIEKSKEVR